MKKLINRMISAMLCRTPRRRLTGFLWLIILAASFANAQTSNERKDTSPHESKTVSVGDIRLHYLDWGGTGDVVLFISGSGDTAHAFDQLAPELTDRFRVLGLTRRGFSESDKPEKGYDVPSLTEDVRRFLDILKIERVNLIGHSAGGNELIYFAGKYLRRTQKLVFLDAAYDRRDVPALEAKDPLPDPPSIKPLDQMSLDERIEKEYFREMFSFRPNFKKIKAPTLNFYVIFEKHWALKPDTDDASRSKAQTFIEKFVQPYQNKNIERFRREVPGASIVIVRGSHHYFFRDPKKIDEVVATIRHFLGESKSAVPVTVKTDSPDPTIAIDNYVVVTADPARDLPTAAAVMEVKKRFPLAMRRKDRALFEQILARDFTFRGARDFFNRRDYIDNRTQGPVTDWSVKYENIVLQFVGDRCMLTYRNVITGKDEAGAYKELMTWADVYVREADAWKIETVHLIEYREETQQPKPALTQ